MSRVVWTQSKMLICEEEIMALGLRYVACNGWVQQLNCRGEFNGSPMSGFDTGEVWRSRGQKSEELQTKLRDNWTCPIICIQKEKENKEVFWLRVQPNNMLGVVSLWYVGWQTIKGLKLLTTCRSCSSAMMSLEAATERQHSGDKQKEDRSHVPLFFPSLHHLLSILPHVSPSLF